MLVIHVSTLLRWDQLLSAYTVGPTMFVNLTPALVDTFPFFFNLLQADIDVDIDLDDLDEGDLS